jgi:hypothetical protein
MKVKPINDKIKPLLEKFLAEAELQPKFAEIAKALGYTGTDSEKIKVALFTADLNSKEICFASDEAYTMFLEYQIISQLTQVEPYKTLLKIKPEIKPELILIARAILDGETVDLNRVSDLFKMPERHVVKPEDTKPVS